MRRIILIGCCLALLGVAALSPGVYSQTSTPADAVISISPRSADAASPRLLRASNLPPSAEVTIVLFDPTGQQYVMREESDPGGALEIPLNPPSGGWIPGLYRAAISLAGGRTVTATFAATDGTPQLYLAADLPSVTSALNFSGTGFTPNQPVNLVLRLGNDRGDRSIPVVADADGLFSVTVWPQQEGEPFFEAGGYAAIVASDNLYQSFFVREHPAESLMTITAPSAPGGPVHFHLTGYRGSRYLWITYSDLAGTNTGELLLGPTDTYGRLDEDVSMPPVPGGEYLFAAPYDWGESTVILPNPPPTATPTATVTDTSTSTPTVTPTPTPTATSKTACPKNSKKKHGVCVCKKGYKKVHGKCKRVGSQA